MAGTIIFNGEAGTTHTNSTEWIQYQFIASLFNTCGVCLSMHMAIKRGAWAIPYHYNCNCRQVPIKPGADAPNPFVDYREILDNMPHDQQVAAIGASNYKLLKNGVVDWKDIVTPSRVRPLREVVAIKKIPVKIMTGVGVNPLIANRAYESVHTPEHELVEAHRRELIANIERAGLTQQQLVDQLAQGLASRVSIKEGPDNYGLGKAWSGGPVAPLPYDFGGVGHAAALAKLLNVPSIVLPKPAVASPAPPAPLETEPPTGPTPTPTTPSGSPPEPTWAERKEEAIAQAKAAEQAPHSNPMIAEAQRRGAAAGVRTLVVDDRGQSALIWGVKSDNAAASYHAGQDVILLNARSKYWSQAEIDASHSRRWLATNDPNQVINHELGHYAHRHNIGIDRFAEMMKDRKPVGGVMGKRIKDEVSLYAATQRAEVVAEVHAGLLGGKTYSPKIMGYYKTLGGVIPK